MTSPTWVKSKTNDCGGPLDALVNYWLTKILYEDADEARAVPEYNLQSGGAGEALYKYLDGRKVDANILFDLGVELCGIVARDPFNAGEKVRLAVEKATNPAE